MPSCADTSVVIWTIEQEYLDSLRLVVCEFPLAVYHHARVAAAAEEAAAAQGHFWKVQPPFSPENLRRAFAAALAGQGNP